uniref:Uncharacterized protein n=1 Tax=Anopheles maculatus TaxID=74869 RepID=A0A182TB47_9DIPT
MAMFEDADKYNRGAITYEALKNQLEKHGGLLENLSISIDRWLVPLPQDDTKKKRKKKPLPHQLTAPYIKNNYVYLSFLTIFTLINVGLFVSRAIQYRNSNGFVIMARACGQCLNFNCAFILVLMLRQCITFLRTRGFTAFLPLDQHIYLHKLTGMLVAIFSLVHTIMHLFNFSKYTHCSVRTVFETSHTRSHRGQRQHEKPIELTFTQLSLHKEESARERKRERDRTKEWNDFCIPYSDSIS